MDINKDSFKATLEYSGALVSSFAPGVVLLEGVYGRGLFSTPPSDVYQFLLFILWSILISSPFLLLADLALALELHVEKHGLEIKEDSEHLSASIKFPLLVLLVISCYGIYKTSEALVPNIPSELWNISMIHIRLLFAYIATIPIALLIGALYRYAIFRLAEKLVD